MTLWAIKWLPLSGRGNGWLDWTTVTQRRRDTWAKHEANSPNATDLWRAKLKRWRRTGRLKAVKVTLKEIQP